MYTENVRLFIRWQEQLHVEIGSESYFVPEKHIAWIPQGAEHKLSSNSRQEDETV